MILISHRTVTEIMQITFAGPMQIRFMANPYTHVLFMKHNSKVPLSAQYTFFPTISSFSPTLVLTYCASTYVLTEALFMTSCMLNLLTVCLILDFKY